VNTVLHSPAGLSLFGRILVVYKPLYDLTGVGLEIKATTREPWGTVGHNVARGWFLTIEYELDSEGLPSFKTVWIGELVEEDFTWYGRSSESRRTITASVKRESCNRKMMKVFQRVSGEDVLTFIK
jgi:hypothetical protein